jgi:hypothetical protein
MKHLKKTERKKERKDKRNTTDRKMMILDDRQIRRKGKKWITFCNLNYQKKKKT